MTGVEARGFIFGPPIALAIGAKFIPLRKPRKLPGTFMFHKHIQSRNILEHSRYTFCDILFVYIHFIPSCEIWEMKMCSSWLELYDSSILQYMHYVWVCKDYGWALVDLGISHLTSLHPIVLVLPARIISYVASLDRNGTTLVYYSICSMYWSAVGSIDGH